MGLAAANQIRVAFVEGVGANILAEWASENCRMSNAAKRADIVVSAVAEGEAVALGSGGFVGYG